MAPCAGEVLSREEHPNGRTAMKPKSSPAAAAGSEAADRLRAQEACSSSYGHDRVSGEATQFRSSVAPAAFPDGEPRAALAALIVEASSGDAERAVGALENAGYVPVRWRRVADAAGMEAALAEESWDVVLSDHRMPAVDSFKALAVLGASGLDVPLILDSGAIGEETAAAAIRAGALDFVSEDHLDRLGAAVGRCLRDQVEEGLAGEAAERAERESQERFETSVETLIDPFVLLRPVRDATGEIVDFVYEYANNAACETNVLAREELVRVRVLERFTQLPDGAVRRVRDGH